MDIGLAFDYATPGSILIKVDGFFGTSLVRRRADSRLGQLVFILCYGHFSDYIQNNSRHWYQIGFENLMLCHPFMVFVVTNAVLSIALFFLDVLF